MPVVFKNVKSRNIGASPTGVGTYAVPAATASVVTGLTIANVTSSTTITANVSVYDSSNDYYIAKGIELVPGASITVVGDGNRLVLNAAESVRVESNTATSIDAVMSLCEYS